KFLVLSCSFAFCVLSFALDCFAQEITLLYTGETHSMIYHCNCPVEPDGGVSRRASLVKQIRKSSPNVLLVDSGGFFAGGLMDEYTQNVELDMRRSLVSLKAMELMHYDAVNVGDDEFNFGRKFFEENIAKTKLDFLSANVRSAKLLPYIIKDVAGVKIGIIGVTNQYAAQKADGLEVSSPKESVRQAVAVLKAKGVAVILLLSHLGENEDLKLISDVPGIDIIVVGQSRSKETPSSQVGQTIVLRPSWQGRKLDKLIFTLENGKISKYTTEDIRLSDKINDDPDMLGFLPQCFADANCLKEGLIGACQNPGLSDARCMFSQPQKVSLLVVTAKDCSVCDTEKMTQRLKVYFPGLSASYLYYPDEQAVKLIKSLGVKFLPVYLLGKEAQKEKNFDNLKENLEKNGEFYMVKAASSGMSYLLDRQKIKGRLDLMLSLYDKNTPALLGAIRDFGPEIHFLAIEKDGSFEAAKGNLEIEEYLRAVCVQKYYPDIFWDYIGCRAGNMNTSWWEDCLGKSDAAKITTCARRDEGKELLRKNIAINKELSVMFGPTYLLDNMEIFSTQGVPTKEDFKKIFKK
ncbi:MAG: bifunctional metallophosphatase/5'-nucleotidase, partial [Deltaproteobacteria bacterium]